MTAIREKRTSENLWYDLDCTDLLNAAETIISIQSVSADEAGLIFGTPVVNSQAITYPDGRVAAIGKVLRVQISGGVIQSGKTSQLYTVRAKFTTNDGGNTREATVLLNVTDKVS